MVLFNLFDLGRPKLLKALYHDSFQIDQSVSSPFHTINDLAVQMGYPLIKTKFQSPLQIHQYDPQVFRGLLANQGTDAHIDEIALARLGVAGHQPMWILS